MRGVVSLAAALSIPLTLADGTPFPQRNLILFITFVVILLTLLVQGLTLPFILRKIKLVDRDLDPNIIHIIEPTKQTITKHSGYIAKLSCDKATILNVYLDRKTACKLNNYDSIASLDACVKNFTIKDGFYYKLYNTCDEKLKCDFESRYGTPILYKNGVGKYNMEGLLLQEFLCKYDCIKTLCISDKTLAKCLEKNVSYNNNYFKELGNKLSIL
jgi:hypothetical protein